MFSNSTIITIPRPMGRSRKSHDLGGVGRLTTSPTGLSWKSSNLGRVDRWTSRRLSKVLQDVSTPGLLELAAFLGSEVLFQHFALEGSQSHLEHSRSGSFLCLLHFSQIGERKKLVFHVDEVENEMTDQWDKRFSSVL